MSYALMSSGGKDSTLAAARAARRGLEVRFLANLYDGSTGRVRFHGVRHELIEAQAASLRLECVQASAQPEEFEDVFLRVLDDLKARGCQGGGVGLNPPAPGFLGRELDADLLTEIGIPDGLDAAGECGEYHTFVYDGPSFAYPLLIQPGKLVDFNGHRFLDLTLAPLH